MKISTRFVSIGASALAIATLTACVAPAPVYHTTRYPYQAPPQAVPYQEAAYVEYGHVANIEVLRSETRGTGTTGGGAVAGGVVGGVVGNQFGHGSGRAAATALGIVGGALLGNLVGLIDSDYQGELKISAWNRSDTPFVLQPMERLAQLVIVPVVQAEFRVVTEFAASQSGEGGYGSTGKH